MVCHTVLPFACKAIRPINDNTYAELVQDVVGYNSNSEDVDVQLESTAKYPHANETGHLIRSNSKGRWGGGKLTKHQCLSCAC